MKEEFDRAFEDQVRAELRTSIVPPATPFYVRDRVERMATRALEPVKGPLLPATFRSRFSGAGGVAAIVAIVAIVGVGLAWRGSGLGPAAPAVSLPTLPGTPGPSFPPAPDAASARAVVMSALAPGLTGVISVDGLGYRITHDGGVTWSSMAAAPATQTDPDFDFIDPTHGFVSSVVVGAAVTTVSVYRTTDGARTWQASQLSLPSEAGWQVDAVSHFSDASHGILLVTRFQSDSLKTEECTLYASDDGGATWAGKGAGPCLGAFIWPTWSSALAGYVTSAQDPSQVIVTADGGRTWISGPLPDVSSGWRAAPQLVLVDGAGRLRLLASMTPTTTGAYTPRTAEVYASSDGGVKWTKQYAVGTIPDSATNLLGLSVYSVSVLGPDYWIALQQGSGPEKADMLVRTLDAGRTWSVVPSTGFTTADGMVWWDARHGMLEGMLMVCDPSGSQCGADHPTVYVTDDGGLTWHQVPF